MKVFARKDVALKYLSNILMENWKWKCKNGNVKMEM